MSHGAQPTRGRKIGKIAYWRTCVTRGTMIPMSTAPNEHIPALTLGWRLKMALADSDLSREDMAEQLGVTVSTLSRWQGDRGAAPSRAYIRLWAELTGVSLRWLETGEGQSTTPDPGGGLDLPMPSAVADLAASKRGRTRGRTTHRYPLDAVVAA